MCRSETHSRGTLPINRKCHQQFIIRKDSKKLTIARLERESVNNRRFLTADTEATAGGSNWYNYNSRWLESKFRVVRANQDVGVWNFGKMQAGAVVVMDLV